MKFHWLAFCSPLRAREAPPCGRGASHLPDVRFRLIWIHHAEDRLSHRPNGSRGYLGEYGGPELQKGNRVIFDMTP